MNEFEGPDRRKTSRDRLDKHGVIASPFLRDVIACKVYDVSKAGARLQVENVNVIPDAFTLKIEGDSFEAECITVWRGLTDVGVVFESASKHKL